MKRYKRHQTKIPHRFASADILAPHTLPLFSFFFLYASSLAPIDILHHNKSAAFVCQFRFLHVRAVTMEAKLPGKYAQFNRFGAACTGQWMCTKRHINRWNASHWQCSIRHLDEWAFFSWMYEMSEWHMSGKSADYTRVLTKLFNWTM